MNPGKREGVPHFNFDFWLILLVGFCSLALHLLYRRRKTQFKVFRALFEPKKGRPKRRPDPTPAVTSTNTTTRPGRAGSLVGLLVVLSPPRAPKRGRRQRGAARAKESGKPWQPSEGARGRRGGKENSDWRGRKEPRGRARAGRRRGRRIINNAIDILQFTLLVVRRLSSYVVRCSSV